MDVLIQDIFNFCGKKQDIFISEGRIHKICESGILKPGKAWQVIDGSGFMALQGWWMPMLIWTKQCGEWSGFECWIS